MSQSEIMITLAPTQASAQAPTQVSTPASARFVVVSGLSGAGKTTALQALEEFGYFTADNLPPSLYLQLWNLCQSRDLQRVAVVADARTRHFLSDLLPALAAVAQCLGRAPEILFVEAEDEVLIRRYGLTRRSHPLHEASLLVNFRQEREVLATLHGNADVVIDSSNLSARGLVDKLRQLFGAAITPTLRLFSFGFKHGTPRDADLLLDVRGLPNPHWDETLKHLTGLDDLVKQYVFTTEATSFYEELRHFIESSLKFALAGGRNVYTVGIGCTGGKHRSVAVTEKLAHDLSNYAVVIEHRDIDKDG
jgi:RNase adapter protein RapZ